MSDIDLTKLSRQKALQVCKEAFGLDDQAANDFLDLARGEVTTKAKRNPRKIKRDRFGRFAHTASLYGKAVAAGVVQAGAGAAYGQALRGVLSGRSPGKSLGLALGANLLSQAAGSYGTRLALGKSPKLAKRLARTQKLSKVLAGSAYLAYRLRPLFRAAARGARKGMAARRARKNEFVPDPSKVVNVTNYRFLMRHLTQIAEKAKKASYDQLRQEAVEAFRQQFPNQPSVMGGVVEPYRYVYEVWPGYLICEEGAKYYKVAYDSDLVFADRGDWEEVEREVSWQSKQLKAQPFVFKEENGDYRWVLLSSNGFRDRDGQIVSTKSLERDVALWDLDNAPPDPLRWWHVALDDAEGEPREKGLELGTVDFRMVNGLTLIESGTFLNKEIGEGVYNARDQLEASVGFRHPANEPDEDGVFSNVHIFERSLLPKGNASNPLTQLLVTE